MSAALPAVLRLPLDFDAVALQADLARVPGERWIAHVNARDYEGDWSGVALRGPAWATHPVQSLIAHPGETDWADTDLVAELPAFRAALARFHCPLLSVRLLRLATGAVIREHSDPGVGLEAGEVRLHVPVVTHPDVELVVDGERRELGAGETWYLDASRPHSVRNPSPLARVHLVLDCRVDEWLRELLLAAAAPSRERG